MPGRGSCLIACSYAGRVAKIKVNLGVLVFEFDTNDYVRFQRDRSVLSGGPCLVLCRQWGRALEVGQTARSGVQPWVWDTHGLPWQQWLIEPARDRDTYRFCSVASGLDLTAEGTDDWSPIRLRKRRGEDASQLWRLLPSDDGAAFAIENVHSGRAIDATREPHNETKPHQSELHWGAWQQWVIARLPVEPGSHK